MLRNSRLRQIITVVMAAFLLLVVYLAFVIWSTFPKVSGEVYADGLVDKVEVQLDKYNIPKIVAEHKQDAFYVQGYLHAQNRLFQMVLMKHMFLGRMSEIFGKKTIAVDRYMRYFNVGGLAKETYPKLSKDTREILESYAKGVNRYISENRKTLEQRLLGFEVENWRAEDSLVIQKAMAFDLSRHWPLILKNTALSAAYGNQVLDEFYPYEALAEPSVLDEDLKSQGLPYREVEKVYPDGPAVSEAVVESYRAFAELSHGVLSGLSSDDTSESGSNIWAVGNTDTHKPYIASDPHLSYRVPNMFYLLQIKVGAFELEGASIPGAPGVIIGRNQDIAWGFTNGKLAQSDIFYAKDIKGKVKREERIKVAKGEDITMTYYDSDYGVLISEKDAEYEVSMNWTALSKEDVTLDALMGINASTSLKEAKRHLKYFHSPAQNLVMIDSQGRYGFFALGAVPIRKHSGRIAVPATDAYRWKSYIPTSEMPRVENPPRGYVMNANNDVTSRHYGHNLSRLDFDNLRAIRLSALLKRKGQFDLEDMRSIQLDNEDQKWIVMREVLLSTKPKDKLSEKALEALRNWDGFAVKDSYEISIFSVWMREIAKDIYHSVSKDMPKWTKPDYSDVFIRDSLKNNGRFCQIEGKSCEALLTETLARSVKKLKKHHGRGMKGWRWDKLHVASFKHAIFKKVPILRSLSTREIPVNGARDTLNRSRWYSSKKGFKAIEGASLRMLANTDSKVGYFSMPMGQSENVFSKHFDDILPLWAEGGSIVLPEAKTKVDMTFYPSKD